MSSRSGTVSDCGQRLLQQAQRTHRHSCSHSHQAIPGVFGGRFFKCLCQHMEEQDQAL